MQPSSLPSESLARHGVGDTLLRGLRLGPLRPDEKIFEVDTNAFLHAVKQPRQADLQRAGRNGTSSGGAKKRGHGCER